MDKEVNTEMNTEFLRENAWKGFIGFTVKAKDNDKNLEVHNKFREFCKENTDGNYTLGIKQLIEIVDSDYKYQSLFDLIMDLQDELEELKREIKQDKKEVKDEVEENAF